MLPKQAFESLAGPSGDLTEVLGLDLGVQVPTPDDLPAVLFASMSGRTASFDSGSFARWNRQMEPGDPRSDFARRMAFDPVLPIENSPIVKDSLAGLATRGPAWVIAGSQVWAERPVAALGIVVAGEFGAVVVGVVRGFGASAATAARYHTRRLLKVPEDWVPPEDRP